MEAALQVRKINKKINEKLTIQYFNMLSIEILTPPCRPNQLLQRLLEFSVLPIRTQASEEEVQLLDLAIL